MHFQLLPPIASLKRNPPLKWNLSMTGNLLCFKLYRTHVKNKLSFRAERSVAKNLGNIYVDVHEILPPFGRLNDMTGVSTRSYTC